MSAVRLDRVTKVYNNGVLAVDGVRLEVEQGEVLVLLGPSGCGKTTILRIIAGLEELTSGNVWLGDQLATGLRPRDRNIAMVFQHCALYPHLTVRDNLAFPLKMAQVADKPARDEKVREIAHGLGIEDTLDRRPGLLSGGQRQRVAIGRALIRGKPTALLMDEPLASLDVGPRSGLRAEIASLIRSLVIITVYVTHEHIEALSLADRVAVLRNGVVEAIGTPDGVYRDPATAFVAGFLGSPPTNLAWAATSMVPGEQVIIDFGRQRLVLPWNEPMSEALTPYEGQAVIVGIRPEALTPAQADSNGLVLRGKVTSLEYHGHEWLARLEVGFRPVDLASIRARPQHPGPPGLGTADRRSSSGGDTSSADQGRHGGHPGASLLVRLGSPPWVGPRPGGRLGIQMRPPYVFDAFGKRVESPAWAHSPSRVGS